MDFGAANWNVPVFVIKNEQFRNIGNATADWNVPVFVFVIRMKNLGIFMFLQLIGICLFLYGFFPIKSLDRSKANFAEYRQLRDEFPSINFDGTKLRDTVGISSDFSKKIWGFLIIFVSFFYLKPKF